MILFIENNTKLDFWEPVLKIVPQDERWKIAKVLIQYLSKLPMLHLLKTQPDTQ